MSRLGLLVGWLLLAAPALARLPRIALVIDDIGLRRDALDPLLAIPALHGKVTYAVIPGTPFATAMTRELCAAGEPLIAHLPMEPSDPREMTPTLAPYLRRGQEPDAIVRAIRARLDALPEDARACLQGASNHQGSGFTEDASAMRAALAALSKAGLYFLDSRTSSRSVAIATARRLGMPHAARDVFLDHERRVASIALQLDRALRVAQARGVAIAIGHPYPETAEALAAWLVKTKGQLELVALETVLSR